MTQTNKKTGRFLFSPVEIIIFGIITLVFFNSIYQLFYDFRGVQVKEIAMARVLEDDLRSSSRSPSAIAPASFESLEIKCDSTIEKQTSSQRLRLSGSLCGLDQFQPENLPTVKTEIYNAATKTTASVYSDPVEGTFLTDFIPLASGDNTISIKFIYSDGNAVEQSLRVFRRE